MHSFNKDKTIEEKLLFAQTDKTFSSFSMFFSLILSHRYESYGNKSLTENNLNEITSCDFNCRISRKPLNGF